LKQNTAQKTAGSFLVSGGGRVTSDGSLFFIDIRNTALPSGSGSGNYTPHILPVNKNMSAKIMQNLLVIVNLMNIRELSFYWLLL